LEVAEPDTDQPKELFRPEINSLSEN